MTLYCKPFITGDRVRNTSRNHTRPDLSPEPSIADSIEHDYTVQRKKKQRHNSQISPDQSTEATIADSSDDDYTQRKKKNRRTSHFSKHQRSRSPHAVSSRSSKTKSNSTLSSKPSEKKGDSDKNIYDGTQDDTRNWTEFLKEKVVYLFRLKFLVVSTMSFINLHFISTRNRTQIVCNKSLKPRETLKEYRSFNNVIAITVLRAIVLHYKRYAEESYLDLTEEEESYLDSLYNGSKSSKHIVSCQLNICTLLCYGCYY